MNSLHILILSNARPSRSWRFANRLAHEVPGAEICGIVQRPIQELPRVQQLVWAGGARGNPALPGRRSRLHLWLSSIAEILARRSEEHTSELQSLAYLVCRLLLEKKKN